MGMIVCFMTSCKNEISADEPTVELTKDQVELTSAMSESAFLTACLDVKSQMKSVSRSLQFTELEAEQVLQPFVEDGLQLKTQIVEQIEIDPSLQVETAYFENLSDEDCAALSFVFHSMNDAGMDIGVVTGLIDDTQYQTMSVNTDRLLHCASVAIGYDTVVKIGVKGIVTAATVRQAIIAIGKRYLGYIGLAIMVYEFVECIR